MPERPRLEAVLLDAGGTLVRLDFEWIAGMLGALGHATDTGVLRRAEIEGRRRYDASAGRALAPDEDHPALGSSGDVRAYFRGMLEASGVPAALIDPAYAALKARQTGQPIGLWARPVEGARETLPALRALGLRLAVVSNSDGRAEDHLAHNHILDGIEFVVDSQIVGIEKPDPGIFRIALERMGLEPDRALYVGDIRSVDERGARAAGMHTVILDPYGDYVPAGHASIPRIADLPEWIRSHFDVPNPTARAAVPAPDGGPSR